MSEVEVTKRAFKPLRDVRVGHTYTDAQGRKLRVREHHPGAQDGREVVGTLTDRDGREHPYATDAKIFWAVWIDRVPPTSEQDWHKPGE